MSTIRQMLRQLGKTVFGIIAITLACAVLCLCVCQAIIASVTGENLEYSFSSVAIPTYKYHNPNIVYAGLSDENVEWSEAQKLVELQESFAEAYPEIVQGISSPSLANAYLSELKPINYTTVQNKQQYYGWSQRNRYLKKTLQQPLGSPHSCAMLEITVNEIGQTDTVEEEYIHDPFSVPDQYYADRDMERRNEIVAQWNNLERTTVISGYTQELKCTIEHVISLEEGYNDPTGWTLTLTVTLPTEKEIQDLNIIQGQRYLVYGMDYYDLDWELRGNLAHERAWGVYVESFIPENFFINEAGGETTTYYNIDGEYMTISASDLEKINAVSMSLAFPNGEIEYTQIRDENGVLQDLQQVTEKSYTDETGQTVTVSLEEYARRYRVPTIAALTGTAEEFLASPEGEAWRQALERDAVNNHAFPFVGVDKLGYIAEFAREDARIVEGRDFTREELDSGAMVCVISEELAAANGLKVGDTINPNFYATDEALPYQAPLSEYNGTNNPVASFYFSTTPLLGEQSYTIVGLYRQAETWQDITLVQHTFTPNTIFAPKASVTVPTQTSDRFFFRTVVLHHGKVDAFAALISEAGCSEQFLLYDQGYTETAGNFHDFAGVSRQALLVGLAVYGVLILLFLLLFPGSKGKDLRRMDSLGAPRRHRWGHVFLGAAALLVSGTVLGTALGAALWQKVVGRLMASLQTEVTLELDLSLLVRVGAVQLGAVLAVVALQALIMARPWRLSRRR